MKKKKVLIPIIVGIVVVLILLFIFLIYPKFINKNNKKLDEDDKKLDANKIKEIYSKYQDIDWTNAEVSGFKDENLKIVNNKIECSDKYKIVCDLSKNIDEKITKIVGTYTYEKTALNNYYDKIYLMTESNKIYSISLKSVPLNDDNDASIAQILEDYYIIDMTTNVPINYIIGDVKNIYFGGVSLPFHLTRFLTSDGKLIDGKGNEYKAIDKDFVFSNCNNSQYCVYYSLNDNSIRYRKIEQENTNPDKIDDYIIVMNKNNEKLIAKYVYDINYDSNYPNEILNLSLIVDENNDLYEINYNEINANYIGKVFGAYLNSIGYNEPHPMYHSEGEYALTFYLSDGVKKVYSSLKNYHVGDISTKEYIKVSDTSKIYSETNSNFSSNPADTYKSPEMYNKYPNIKWAGTNGDFYDNEAQLKIVNGKLECNSSYPRICDKVKSITEPLIRIAYFGYPNGYYYLLTESGKVYEIRGCDNYNSWCELEQKLSNYKIIGMTKTNITNYDLVHLNPGLTNDNCASSVGGCIFYLTEDGKLIAENGAIYEELN